MDELDPDIKRRKFLQTTGSITATSAFIQSVGTASAKKTELYIGEIFLVEALLRYKCDITPDAHGDGNLPGHIFVPTKNQITLIDASPKDFRQQSFLTAYQGEYGTSGRKMGGRKRRQLISSSSYWQRNHHVYHLDEEFSEPNFEVKKGGNEVEITSGRKKTTVPNQSQKEIELEEINVKRSGDTVKVTPTLEIRNHGQAEAYGKRDAWVLPLNSNIPWVQLAVKHFRQASNKEEDVKASSTDDFLIVKIYTNS